MTHIEDSFELGLDEIGGLRNHNIRNPYIIIIGISDYSESKNIRNLPGVAKDVENMYHLFKNEFGYKHVYQHLNIFKLGDSKKEYQIISRREFTRAFNYHRDQIEKLEETDEKIDGIIFIYSGHGDEGVILGCKGNKIGIPHIQSAFDNEVLPDLEGRPRIYIFDCCRGGDTELSGGKGNNKDPKNAINASKDTVYIYASSEGMKAYERSDKMGGYLLTCLYKVLHYTLKHSQYWDLSSKISTFIFKLVMKEKGENQTPEFKKLVGYEIYFLPSKTSKYKIEVQDDEINRIETIKQIDYSPPEKKKKSASPPIIFIIPGNFGKNITKNPDDETESKEDSDKGFDSLVEIFTKPKNIDKQMLKHMEGLLFGSALGDLFISKIKQLKLKQGQISDITEINVAMMHGIMKMIGYEDLDGNKDDENKTDTKENENENIYQSSRPKESEKNGIQFDIQDFVDEYKLWTKSTKFELGNSIKSCFAKDEVTNMKYKSQMMDSQSKQGGTKSNGSMMRIFPLILFLLPLEDDYKSIFLILKEDSELTHYNYTCHIINCILFFICQYLINNYNDKNKHINSIKAAEKFLQFLTKLFSENKEKFKKYEKNLNEVKEWLSNGKQSSKNKLFKLKSGAYIRVAFERMIFYLYNKYTFNQALRDLGQARRQSDTAVCAIVGGVLGAYYGIDKLPSDYIDLMKNCNLENNNVMKYQPKQYIDKKFIDFLSKNRLGDTCTIESIRIYKPLDKKKHETSKDDELSLLGEFEFVEYTPRSSDTKFVKCLFYEEHEDNEIDEIFDQRN